MAATKGNGNLMKPTSSSEDVSEYTDADESISAPTEFLAEFLSAVMLKDYETALKYCKLILQYEPNNSTAREFYPLILEKLKGVNGNNEADNNSEDDDEEDENSSSSSSSESSESTSDESSEDQEEEIEIGPGAGKRSKNSSDGTTGSYSSLEDDEAEIDQLAALAAKYRVDNADFGNGNKIFSDTTTVNLKFNTNKIASSDSESPTEPITAQTIAMLRARVVPTHN